MHHQPSHAAVSPAVPDHTYVRRQPNPIIAPAVPHMSGVPPTHPCINSPPAHPPHYLHHPDPFPPSAPPPTYSLSQPPPSPPPPYSAVLQPRTVGTPEPAVADQRLTDAPFRYRGSQLQAPRFLLGNDDGGENSLPLFALLLLPLFPLSLVYLPPPHHHRHLLPYHRHHHHLLLLLLLLHHRPGQLPPPRPHLKARPR